MRLTAVEAVMDRTELFDEVDHSLSSVSHLNHLFICIHSSAISIQFSAMSKIIFPYADDTAFHAGLRWKIYFLCCCV